MVRRTRPGISRFSGAQLRTVVRYAPRNDDSYMVVIHHHPLRTWPRLAGQDKARLQLPRLQRIIHFHLRLALDELGAAGRAHAALAGERQIHAGAQRGIENGFFVGDRHVAALAVDDQGSHRLRRRGYFDNFLRPRLAAELRDETLDVNAFVGNADLAAGRLDVLAHADRAADEDVIDACRRHQRTQQHAYLLAVEAAMQDR